jgi:GDP-D-mannose dehydratase
MICRVITRFVFFQEALVRDVKPDECYHLAAQSFVSYSFEDEFSTMTANINGTYTTSLHL